ncbi:MAG TPA: hypothetical protein VGF71_10940 [Caulobacteraceae bacterium]|jgi:hypothetical protein
MKPLAPYEAVGEGFRLIRREPRAFFVWTAIWFATFSLAAWTVATSRHVALAGPTPANLRGISERFGPYSGPLMILFWVVWLLTAVAAFRAVLKPGDRRAFFLRFGMDELRLGGLTLGAFFAAIPFGGAPAYLVFLLATPFIHAIPTAAGIIGWIGVFLTVGLDIWLGVRLSLIAVETFSERRFHLTAYWPVTRGRFWYLLAVYFIFFLVFLGLTVIFAPFVGLASSVGEGPSRGMAARGGLLVQAGVLTILISLFWTLTSTVFYACQAHAFREIIGQGRAGVPPA